MNEGCTECEEYTFEERMNIYKSLKNRLEEISKIQSKHLQTFTQNGKYGFSKPRYLFKDGNIQTSKLYPGLISTCLAVTSLKNAYYKNQDKYFKNLWSENGIKAYADYILQKPNWGYFQKKGNTIYEKNEQYERLDLGDLVVHTKTHKNLPFSSVDKKEIVEIFKIVKYEEDDIYSFPIILEALRDLDVKIINDSNKMIINAIDVLIENLNKNNGSARYSKKFPQSGFLTYCTIRALFRWFDQFDDPQKKKFFKSIKKVHMWIQEEIEKQTLYYTSNNFDRTDPIRCIFCLATYKLLYNKTEMFKKNGSDFVVKKINNRHIDTIVDFIFRDQDNTGLWKRYLPIVALPFDGNVYPFAPYSLKTLIELVYFPSSSLFTKYTKQIETTIEWIENNQRENIPLEHDGEKPKTPHKVSGWLSNHSTNPDAPPQAWSTSLVFTTVNAILRKLDEDITKDIVNHYGGILKPIFKKELKDFEKSDNFFKIAFDENSSSPIQNRSIVNDMFAIIKDKDKKIEKNAILLYGPPGTGKTTLVKAVAEKLGWSFLVIDTGLIFKDGPDLAINNINKLFDNLTHLKETIVLFDEIDECIRTRIDVGENSAGDYENRILTNTMLTKLQNLSDINKQIIYFVNTNHFDFIDSAIKRPGRFDYLIHIGQNRNRLKIKINDKRIWKLNDERLCELTSDEWKIFVDFVNKTIWDKEFSNSKRITKESKGLTIILKKFLNDPEIKMELKKIGSSLYKKYEDKKE